VNETTREVTFAGAVSGGVVSGPVLANVVAEIVETSASLEQSVARPRVFHPGDPDVVVVEQTVGEAVVAELATRGHEVRVAPELGRVNAIFCPEGLRNGNESCQFVTDPRAFGLATGG
jgi:gamma-glutamyltranspeptidase/glutathione hydrolase